MDIPVTVATWNVNSLRSRLDHVLRFLDAHAPDVLCLQEIKCTADALPEEPFRERGYRIAAACQKTYNGVAIVSPFPMTDVREGFADGEPDPQARLIAATVRGIRVLNAYVPNGAEVGSDKYAYKLEWMARLADALRRHHDPYRPTLLCGDFNVAPDDRDVHDPKAWAGKVLCSAPEREGVAGWRGWGLTDAFRHLHPDAPGFSWWDYRAGAYEGDRGLRIDHIWVTCPLAACLADCRVEPSR
jgi:exodeoxyribonuclease-3